MQSTWLLQTTETRKKSVDLWAKEAAYRNSQAGNHLLFNFQEVLLKFKMSAHLLVWCHTVIEDLGWVESRDQFYWSDVPTFWCSKFYSILGYRK